MLPTSAALPAVSEKAGFSDVVPHPEPVDTLHDCEGTSLAYLSQHIHDSLSTQGSTSGQCWSITWQFFVMFLFFPSVAARSGHHYIFNDLMINSYEKLFIFWLYGPNCGTQNDKTIQSSFFRYTWINTMALVMVWFAKPATYETIACPDERKHRSFLHRFEYNYRF